MRITKILAHNITQKLCEPKQEALSKIETKVDKLVNESFKKLVPTKMMNIYKEFPEYFRHTSYLNVTGYPLVALRMPSRNDGYARIHDIPKEEGEVIIGLINQYVTGKKELNKKKEELERTILSFQTVKRLEADFNEAYQQIPQEFLASNGQHLPAKNIDHLKEWVKEKPSAVK